MAHELESDRYTVARRHYRAEKCADGCAHFTPETRCCSLVDARCAAWRRAYKLAGELPDADAPGCPAFCARLP